MGWQKKAALDEPAHHTAKRGCNTSGIDLKGNSHIGQEVAEDSLSVACHDQVGNIRINAPRVGQSPCQMELRHCIHPALSRRRALPLQTNIW